MSELLFLACRSFFSFVVLAGDALMGFFGVLGMGCLFVFEAVYHIFYWF